MHMHDFKLGKKMNILESEHKKFGIFKRCEWWIEIEVIKLSDFLRSADWSRGGRGEWEGWVGGGGGRRFHR